MKTPTNLTQKTNLTEAHYVTLRILVAMVRDKRIGAVACKHTEVSRAVEWLCTQFGGVEALIEASQLIGQEQLDLRQAYEAGVAATGMRGAIRAVLDAECDADVLLTRYRSFVIAEKLYCAMSNHIHDMVKAQIISSRPEDPMPDACLAISSEE